jgi:hypothetical protein
MSVKGAQGMDSKSVSPFRSPFGAAPTPCENEKVLDKIEEEKEKI